MMHVMRHHMNMLIINFHQGKIVINGIYCHDFHYVSLTLPAYFLWKSNQVMLVDKVGHHIKT